MEVHGFLIENVEHKLGLYADDIAFFFFFATAHKLFKITVKLDLFASASGSRSYSGRKEIHFSVFLGEMERWRDTFFRGKDFGVHVPLIFAR